MFNKITEYLVVLLKKENGLKVVGSGQGWANILYPWTRYWPKCEWGAVGQRHNLGVDRLRAAWPVAVCLMMRWLWWFCSNSIIIIVQQGEHPIWMDTLSFINALIVIISPCLAKAKGSLWPPIDFFSIALVKRLNVRWSSRMRRLSAMLILRYMQL